MVIPHVCSHISLLEKASTVHTTPLGRRTTGGSTLGPSRALLYVPPSFADFNWYPFTVIN